MNPPTDGDLQRYADVLRQHAGTIHGLPDLEESIARGAVEGRSVHEIAQENRISEEAVWNLLESLTRALSGRQPQQPVETGGFGSDTDPGVTGGYGETGFGSIGNEPPFPTPEEPRDEP